MFKHESERFFLTGKALIRVPGYVIGEDGSFTIPEGVTTVGDEAFTECENLQAVTLSDSVISIGNGAFLRCRNLQTIIIPNNVTYIGYMAFAGCENLQAITFPDNLTSINDGTCLGCKNLQAIILPVSLTTIGARVFSGCENLRTIIIPAGVTSIGDEAFMGCENLHTIVINSACEREVANIIRLLPEPLREKVITKNVADEILKLQRNKLAELIQFTPEINPLYQFFNSPRRNKKLIEKLGHLPEMIICKVTAYTLASNIYYKQAQESISKLPWPRNASEFADYEKHMDEIIEGIKQEAKVTRPNTASTKRKQNNEVEPEFIQTRKKDKLFLSVIEPQRYVGAQYPQCAEQQSYNVEEDESLQGIVDEIPMQDEEESVLGTMNLPGGR